MNSSVVGPKLLSPLQSYVEMLLTEFNQISPERKELLAKLTQYIQVHQGDGKPIELTFICTHNSRRSHLSQLWAQTAAHYYNIANIKTYSGGTEATAFNPRAVKAVEKAGFEVALDTDPSRSDNPVYLVKFSSEAQPMLAFSKVYDQQGNPTTGFGAVMTCTHADENCPFIPGATRISLPFDDPKAFDGTAQEEAKYDERTRQIGREIFYAFSRIVPTI